MKKEFRENLQKGRIYQKDGVWVVRYEILLKRQGGCTKQLGSYITKTEVNYIPIREQDTKNLRHPYDQAKETCFEIITQGENLDQYAKIWSTSEWVQNFQYYLENTPQEELDKAWEETKEFSNTGPTVEEFLGVKERGMNIIFSYTPSKVKEPAWYKFYNTEEFVNTTQRDYTVRAAASLDLIPEPKCFSLEFLSKHGDHSNMMLKKKI
jgi:hypothetical protein